MKLVSSAFQHGANIPRKYTCQGEDINPPLEILESPEGTKSFALIVDDPDAPAGTWVHWVAWNILPSTGVISENSVPASSVQGKNSWGKASYGGPCPPSGRHRYYFKLFALDIVFAVHAMDAQQLETAMKGHVLARAELMGTYQKS